MKAELHTLISTQIPAISREQLFTPYSLLEMELTLILVLVEIPQYYFIEMFQQVTTVIPRVFQCLSGQSE